MKSNGAPLKSILNTMEFDGLSQTEIDIFCNDIKPSEFINGLPEKLELKKPNHKMKHIHWQPIKLQNISDSLWNKINHKWNEFDTNKIENKFKIKLNSIKFDKTHVTMRQLFLFSFMTNNELICNNVEYALKCKNMNKLPYILCTLDNDTLKSVQKQFKFKHTSMNHKTKTIKQYIYKITTNLFHQRNIGKYLLKILNCKRLNDTQIDMKTVENGTKILYKHLKNAIIQNLNKELLMIMFANRSFEHLYYISLKYKQNYNVSLTKTLKNLFKVKSETGYAILLTLNYAINKCIVFGHKFAKDIHINDRNNSAFVIFVMLHYDYDLKNIIEYFICILQLPFLLLQIFSIAMIIKNINIYNRIIKTMSSILLQPKIIIYYQFYLD